MAKIILIDDSPATIEMLEGILKNERHSVRSYTDATGVEDKIVGEKAELVLLDVVMPERNGFEVLRALKRNEATKSIPVVMVSTKGEDTDIRLGLRLGAADYVTKPFTPETVMAAVNQQV